MHHDLTLTLPFSLCCHKTFVLPVNYDLRYLSFPILFHKPTLSADPLLPPPRFLSSSAPSLPLHLTYRAQQTSDSRLDPPYQRQNGEYDPSGVTLPSQAGVPAMHNGRSNVATPISDQPQIRSSNPQQQMHVGNSEYQQRQIDGDGGEYAEHRRGGNKFLNFLLCRCG